MTEPAGLPLRIDARESVLRCPLCSSPLGGEVARVCERCRTATHAACAGELAVECPTRGCEHAVPRIVIAARTAPAAATRPGRRWGVLVLPALVVAVLGWMAVTPFQPHLSHAFDDGTTRSGYTVQEGRYTSGPAAGQTWDRERDPMDVWKVQDDITTKINNG